MKSKHAAHPHHKEDADEPPVTEAVVEERKPATEPWRAENAPDSPRKRGLLGVNKSKPGHTLRWVRLDAVDRRKNQGYELATAADFNATPDENGMIRRNELVLMTVPDEVYNQRRSEIHRMTLEQSQAPKREYLRERAHASRQAGHELADEDRDRE